VNGFVIAAANAQKTWNAQKKSRPEGRLCFSILKVRLGRRFATGYRSPQVSQAPALAVEFGFLDGNLQLCSPLLPLLFGKLALAPLESGEFLLRRLQKAVA